MKRILPILRQCFYTALEQCLFICITTAQLKSALNIILVVNPVRAFPAYVYQPKQHVFCFLMGNKLLCAVFKSANTQSQTYLEV